MNASKNIVRLGIDSGKRTFHLSGVDAEGRMILRRKLSRQKLLAFLVRLEPRGVLPAGELSCAGTGGFEKQGLSNRVRRLLFIGWQDRSDRRLENLLNA